MCIALELGSHIDVSGLSMFVVSSSDVTNHCVMIDASANKIDASANKNAARIVQSLTNILILSPSCCTMASLNASLTLTILVIHPLSALPLAKLLH